LPEADEGGKFIALADDAFGSSGAASHGAADNVLRDLAEIGGGFRISRYDFG
jgi:hypothetical protein